MPRHSKAIQDLSVQGLSDIERLGQYIKEAITCRETLQEFASRTQMGRDTLRKVIKGDPNLPIGFYAIAIETLGFDQRLSEVAAPEKDSIGQGIRLNRFGRDKNILPSDF